MWREAFASDLLGAHRNEPRGPFIPCSVAHSSGLAGPGVPSIMDSSLGSPTGHGASCTGMITTLPGGGEVLQA